MTKNKFWLRPIEYYSTVDQFVISTYYNLENHLEEQTHGELRATVQHYADEIKLTIYGLDGSGAGGTAYPFESVLDHVDGDELSDLAHFFHQWNEQVSVEAQVPDELVERVEFARYATDAGDFGMEYSEAYKNYFIPLEEKRANLQVTLYNHQDAIGDVTTNFYTNQSIFSLYPEKMVFKQAAVTSEIEAIQLQLETVPFEEMGHWYIKPDNQDAELLLVEATQADIDQYDRVYRELAVEDIEKLVEHEQPDNSHWGKQLPNKFYEFDFDSPAANEFPSSWGKDSQLKDLLQKEQRNPNDHITEFVNEKIQLNDVELVGGQLTYHWNDAIGHEHKVGFQVIPRHLITHDEERGLLKSGKFRPHIFDAEALKTIGITDNELARQAAVALRVAEKLAPSEPEIYEVDPFFDPAEYYATVSTFEKYSTYTQHQQAGTLVFGTTQERLSNSLDSNPIDIKVFTKPEDGFDKETTHNIMVALIDQNPSLLERDMDNRQYMLADEAYITSSNKEWNIKEWNIEPLDGYPKIDTRFDGEELVYPGGRVLTEYAELMSGLTTDELVKQIEYSELENELIEQLADHIKYYGIEEFIEPVNDVLKKSGEHTRFVGGDWQGYSQGEGGSILIRTNVQGMHDNIEYNLPMMAAWACGDETFVPTSIQQQTIKNNEPEMLYDDEQPEKGMEI